MRVAFHDSITGVSMPDDELGTSLPENHLETAYGLTPPDAYELRLGAGVYQEYLASEQHIEQLRHPLSPNVDRNLRNAEGQLR